MYMFHGGTTRGFMNGANYNDKNPYETQISSYDYDAPLDEAGNPTEKFMRFREVIGKHLPEGVSLPAVPAAKKAVMVPAIEMNEHDRVLDIVEKPVQHATPLTFEDLRQDYGYVLYRTYVTGGHAGVLKIGELRDYAVVLVNGSPVGTLDRRLKQDSMLLALPKGKVQLDILVENLGRINFGPYLLKNKKGITGEVSFGGQPLKGCNMYGLPFRSTDGLKMLVGHSKGPVVRKGSFELAEVGDTYLDMRAWGKGVVWVNGHNLGRYWNVGPQQTVYVPVEWLKKGKNEVVVLELLKTDVHTLMGIDRAVLHELGKD